MGHFGLAKHFYSHFTSPIRRYPDLILHRQLAGYLTGVIGAARAPDGYLRRMAVHCTEREQRADDAERALLEIKKYRYLKQVLDEGNGETFDAVVSKVTSYGLFVDLPALQVGGLVHIGSISRSFVRFDRGANALSADGRSYGVGDELRVVVANVDFLQRKLDFAIVREKAPFKPSGKAPKGREASKARKTPGKKGRDAGPARGKAAGGKKAVFHQKRNRRH
jgi:ribonuclease R